jgi:hypothetical protein
VRITIPERTKRFNGLQMAIARKMALPAWINQRLYQQIFVAICLGALLLPCTGVSDFRQIEKTFWGRSWLIRAFADTGVFLQNKTFDSSIISDDNWLIFTEEMDDYQNTIPFSEEDLATIQRKMDGLASRLEAKGVKKLIVVLAPNKSTIYPELMPASIPKIGAQSRLDQLLNYEKSHGNVKILDLRPVLLAAKSESQVYYRTDSHWNPLGSFLAYQAIMQEVQEAYPNIEPHSLRDFQIVPKVFTGDISRQMIKTEIQEDSIQLVPLYEQKTSAQVLWVDKKDSLYNFPITTVMHADRTLPKLVMFRDSASTDIEPLIIDHFSRSVLVWYPPSEEMYYEIEKPDVVIVEIIERNLPYLLKIPD